MTKIIRTPTKAHGGITEAEKAAMDEHAALWIRRALRTDPIDPAKITPAIEGIYAAAGLKRPRVVIVPSPLVMAFAYGAAAAIWHGKGQPITATASATDSAVLSAVLSATDSATRTATRRATDAARACYELADDFGIRCARRWYDAYQGGNMWAPWECYLTAARDILGLRLSSHEAYAHWEQAAIHGGFRVMHPEFCMVCDFPEFIHMDDQNRPHCADGPSHMWRDGWSLFHWHGVPVPEHWIIAPDTMTAAEVLGQENTTTRIAGIEIMGWARLTDSLGAKVVNRHPEGLIGGELLAVDARRLNPDATGTMKLLRAECPRNGIIAFRVPDDISTAHEAQAWKAGLPASLYKLPAIRT